MSSLGIYKPGQGFWTRTMTAIASGLVASLGALWLWKAIATVRFVKVPTIYVQAGVSLGVLGIVAAFVYWLVGLRAGSVDFLIATEGEMKKVNWSTRREVFGSTWVVIGLVVAITLFVTLFDTGFAQLFVMMGVLDAPDQG